MRVLVRWFYQLRRQSPHLLGPCSQMSGMELHSAPCSDQRINGQSRSWYGRCPVSASRFPRRWHRAHRV